MRIQLSRADAQKMSNRLVKLYGRGTTTLLKPSICQWKSIYEGLKTHYTIDDDCASYWEIQICKI